MMKYFIKQLLSISVVLSMSSMALAQNCNTNCNTSCGNGVSPTLAFRSQATDNARKLEGTEGHTHLYDMECWWGMGAIFLEYTQSFRPQKLAQCLFGSDLVGGTNGSGSCNTSSSCDTGCNDGNCLLIQGSGITGTNRNANAWFADYFYLPVDYNGSICLDPRIKNVNIPFDLYLGLDEWMCNLYFRAYGTLTHTIWELSPCENVTAAGSAGYPAGYFSPNAVLTSNLGDSALNFLQGQTERTVDGVLFKPLQKAKMYCSKKTDTGFAGLWLELGWDFINDCDYHFGLGFVAGAPTGGKRRADFVFDPVVGNGNHWAVGGVVTGHYTFWRSCDEDQYFGFHFDANITHLVKAKEERTFDLCGKPNSRYALAMKLSPDNLSNGLATLNADATADESGANPLADVTVAAKQFANEYTPLANLTTFDSNVKIGVQGDIAAKFNFTSCNWSFDLGYNFWGRSCEDIQVDDCDCEASRLNKDCWVLKGNERTYGYPNSDGAVAAGLTATTPVALNGSQSNATIHGGAGNQTGISAANANVDTPCLAYASGTPAAGPFAALMTAPGQTFDEGTAINASKTPVKLTTNDLDLTGTRGISHKLFTHINYTWDCECWIPFVGVGGYAEFGKTNSTKCPEVTTSTSTSTACDTSNKSSCVDCALSQWAVWIRGGISWN